MKLSVNLEGDVLARYGATLQGMADGQAALALSRALNHEGDKARTIIRRQVSRQTGVAYGAVSRKVTSTKSMPSTLAYVIRADGGETNIAAFKGAQTSTGVVASPWGQRRLFPHVFMLKAVKGIKGAVSAGSELEGTLLAFVREGEARGPIRPVFGPNIAREVVKGETKAAFLKAMPAVIDRVGYEINRLLAPR